MILTIGVQAVSPLGSHLVWGDPLKHRDI